MKHHHEFGETTHIPLKNGWSQENEYCLKDPNCEVVLIRVYNNKKEFQYQYLTE